jgi:adenylate cyclase
MMASEIERKFLVLDSSWQEQSSQSRYLRQGYLTRIEQGGNSSIRVRISDTEAWLNIKSSTLGISRLEYEYGIPLEDAREMLDLLVQGPVLEKTRHLIPFEDHTWELDVFHGENQGLVVAEIELTHENETFAKPAWLGREVSADPRYYNVNLITHPWSEWKDDA